MMIPGAVHNVLFVNSTNNPTNDVKLMAVLQGKQKTVYEDQFTFIWRGLVVCVNPFSGDLCWGVISHE